MADRNNQDPNGYMAETMPANNPKPEVTDADREAAAEYMCAVVKSMPNLAQKMKENPSALARAMRDHRIAAERATRERVLEEAARKAEHSCYDYANTIEPSINDDGSKAFGFGFDYACEVIAAAIRAMKEEPKP